jgi:hypothetical protein
MDDNSRESGASIKFTRRNFLRAAGAAFALGVLGKKASERNEDIPANEEIAEASALNAPEAEKVTQTEQQSPLDNYLKEIEPEKQRLLSIIEKQRMFAGFRKLEMEQVLGDFKRNYPFYEAAKRKYGIPVTILWVVHGYETTFSRNPNPDVTVKDEKDIPHTYLGAMQRDPEFYPESVVDEAARGYEFLEALKPDTKEPGYHKANGDKTTDYKEILFAAWKMKKDAELIMKEEKIGFLEAVLKAQYRYSADWTAKDRVETFKKYYPLFQD